jgi:uncharacterized protein (DUF433 family)
MIFNRIEVHPRLRGGEPCIAGTRLTVAEVAETVAAGEAVERIIEAFPQLDPESIAQAVEFQRLRELR